MCTKIGIWLDKRKASIVKLEGKNEILTTIDSNVEEYHLHGGSRSKTAYGPQETVSETKLNERKKHQLKKYFENIVSEVKDASSLIVFGPSEAKVGLNNYLKQIPDLKNKVTSIETADVMTDNQLKAFVRHFFRYQHY
ncbi:MAG: stalled ribosome rescue protein Dom34 [Parvicellaceae bacterium]|jgi:stalled ribosome rescue protein Dom34